MNIYQLTNEMQMLEELIETQPANAEHFKNNRYKKSTRKQS
jgi:uncharacterized membrane protein YkgB